MFAAILFFHEEVPLVRWIGVLLESCRLCVGTSRKEIRYEETVVDAGMVMLLSVVLSAQTLKKATEAEAKVMVAEINKTAASIRTLACNFTQVKTLSFLNDKMTSQGRMCYDASGKLRWEYTSPYTYTFILNGQQVHIQSGKNRQTIDIRQSRLFQGIAQVMMNSVTGRNLTSNKDFACTFLYAGRCLGGRSRAPAERDEADVQHHPSSLRQQTAYGKSGGNEREAR